VSRSLGGIAVAPGVDARDQGGVEVHGPAGSVPAAGPIAAVAATLPEIVAVRTRFERG
jgi:hypothetical protein